MLAGGAEAPLAPLCFGAFCHHPGDVHPQRRPAHASRPFDRGRDGFVMAEGAGRAGAGGARAGAARGAPIYAEICGYGLTNDAHHMTAPRPDGTQAARAMRNALAEKVPPWEVGYINAHGSSTPLNDPTETSSIRQVFGEHADRVPISGTKGYYGHALGRAAPSRRPSALASRRWLRPPSTWSVPRSRPGPAAGDGRRPCGRHQC